MLATPVIKSWLRGYQSQQNTFQFAVSYQYHKVWFVFQWFELEYDVEAWLFLCRQKTDLSWS